jgi:hypothetical protein
MKSGTKLAKNIEHPNKNLDFSLKKAEKRDISMI